MCHVYFIFSFLTGKTEHEWSFVLLLLPFKGAWCTVLTQRALCPGIAQPCGLAEGWVCVDMGIIFYLTLG